MHRGMERGDLPPWKLPADDISFLLELLDGGEQQDSFGESSDRTDHSVSSEDIEKCDDEGEQYIQDGSDALVLRKKRRQKYSREYYRRMHPFTPIFKNDIRRQLGKMWVNVLNWNDPYRTKRFFQHFSTTDCLHVNVFQTPPHIQSLFPTIKPVAGARQALLHGAYNAVCVPDLSCKIVECNIIQSKEDRGTKIALNVHFTGTRVFELGSPKTSTLAMLQSALDTLSLNSLADDADSDRGVLFDDLPHVDLNTLRSMRHRLDNPLALEADGVFVLRLNERHQMIAHEFYWKDVKAKPITSTHGSAVVEELGDVLPTTPSESSSTATHASASTKL